jgi:hypothetical protein
MALYGAPGGDIMFTTLLRCTLPHRHMLTVP